MELKDGGQSLVMPFEPPRDHLVATAVKFLSNPRVRMTSLAKRQKFLRQKGLTDQEIELACEQSESFGEDANMIAVNGRPYYETRTSFWIKAKDVANMVALISIGSYSLYSFWKRYIAPRLFGTRSRHEQNYQMLLTAITKLNENVVELKEMIKNMSQQKAQGSSYEYNELKGQLAAIKSLLLNRSQFPSSPGIPSWQMVESASAAGDNSNENSDENTNRRRERDRDRKAKSDRGRSTKDETEKLEMDLVPGPIGTFRKHPSIDSNNGLHSGSSCEVVFVSKPSSDQDHSDD